ncbi:hypothetical protein BX616_002540 [Lobosporangium transversale]|nr:hypothetical protein BX616_002540 [Lobosporangium transversale]
MVFDTQAFTSVMDNQRTPPRTFSGRANDMVENHYTEPSGSVHLERQQFTDRTSPQSVQYTQLPSTPVNNDSNFYESNTEYPRRRHRTQSSQNKLQVHTPSVQLALANPTLSKSLSSSPAPSRTGSELDGQARAKHTFERNVRRYYYQLTVGCQQSTCTNRLCRSSKSSPKMTKDAAAVLAVQLAARPRLFFCTNCPSEPVILLPDSPLPTMAATTHSRSSSQKRRSLSSKIMASKINNTTPAHAASVEDFGSLKDRRLYEPNEYSKSVPSFSVSHILSPMKPSQPTSPLRSRDGSPTNVRTSPPPPLERAGTPLFRSLLSVSPFSTMFSPGNSEAYPSSSPRRADQIETHGIPMGRSSRSTQRARRFKSTNNAFHKVEGSPSRTEATSSDNGFKTPHQQRSFSPVHSHPDRPPKFVVKKKKSFRIPPSLRKDGMQAMDEGQDRHGGSTTLLGEDVVGLGYSAKMLRSPRTMGLSQFFHSAAQDEGAPMKRNQKHRREISTPHSTKNTAFQPIFGSSRDPDSDGSYTSSSTDDECKYSVDTDLNDQKPFDQSQLHHQPGRTIDISSSQPLSDHSEQKTLGQTPYTYSRSTHWRDSSSSTSSDGDSIVCRDWSTHTPALDSASSYGGLSSPLPPLPSSSSSSRRSSISEAQESKVVLPYLNLQLLRQAIKTYNSSSPDLGSRSPELLICKGFQPMKATGMQTPEEEDRLLYTTSNYLDSEYERNMDNSIKSLSLLELGDDDQEFVLEYQTFAAAKPVLSEDESVRSLESIDGDSDPKLDVDQINLSSKEGTLSPFSSSDVDDPISHSRFGSPSRSTVSSSACLEEGDSTFLVDSLRSVFSSASALGSSFLVNEDSCELEEESSHTRIIVGGINLEALRECYEMLIELKPRTIFAIQVTNSMEILLARLELEQEAANGYKTWTEQEMRAIIILLMVSN